MRIQFFELKALHQRTFGETMCTVTWTGRNVFIAERDFVKLSCDPVLGLWKVCEKETMCEVHIC